MSFSFHPGKTVDVPDIPYGDEVVLAGGDTAVIVVDMQNDFVAPDGALVTPSAAETVPRIGGLVNAARAAGARVVFTQDTQVPDDPEFEIWAEHCVRGTWGWEIVEELAPASDDLVCPKNRYDGFYGTWMNHFLGQIWGVENVVIVGTVSNICVLHTAASAGLRWYHVVVPADAVSAHTSFDQAMTLAQVAGLYAGDVVRGVDDIRLEDPRPA